MSVYRSILGLSVFLLSLAGCQSIIQSPSSAADGLPQEMIDVQIRPAFGKARNEQIPFTANMTLQDVVKKTKVRFRNKFAHIVRTSPETGESHKLEGVFGSNRRITLQTDYAIQSGDRVVITQDTTTSFDRVMRSMFGGS